MAKYNILLKQNFDLILPIIKIDFIKENITKLKQIIY